MRQRGSARAREIPPSGIRKFFDLLLTMEDVISLGVGEPDFETPWNVAEAGIYGIEQGHTSYTSNKGLLPLRQLVARDLRERPSTWPARRRTGSGSPPMPSWRRSRRGAGSSS
jgi:aminotransferase